MSAPSPSSEVLAFELQPFGQNATELGLRLAGWLKREGAELRLRYQLSGTLDSVVVPPPATDTPERRDGLWEHTCFELFLAAEGAQPYWEVNLAPNGDWNLYRLEDYRQGLQPVPDREAMPFTVNKGAEGLHLTITLALPEELGQACKARPLRLGMSAVIEQQGGVVSYWALAHGGAEADFHRREDFRLRLEPDA